MAPCSIASDNKENAPDFMKVQDLRTQHKKNKEREPEWAGVSPPGRRLRRGGCWSWEQESPGPRRKSWLAPRRANAGHPASSVS